MKTIDALITEYRDATYDTGWIAGRIEEMVKHKVDADNLRQLLTVAITVRQTAEKALRAEVQK